MHDKQTATGNPREKPPEPIEVCKLVMLVFLLNAVSYLPVQLPVRLRNEDEIKSIVPMLCEKIEPRLSILIREGTAIEFDSCFVNDDRCLSLFAYGMVLFGVFYQPFYRDIGSVKIDGRGLDFSVCNVVGNF